MSANSFDVVYYQGGRYATAKRGKRNDDDGEASAPSPPRTDPAFDDQLPEGVDYSEGGWATDFAVSLISLLFFISSIIVRKSSSSSSSSGSDGGGVDGVDDTTSTTASSSSDKNMFRENSFLYMYIGTGLAHFFGGLAHRFYPNRAADGVGMKGFYRTMVLGYGGNCLRYSLGWGLHELPNAAGRYLTYWPYIGLFNWLYLIVTAGVVIIKMKPTNERLDDGAYGNDFKLDRFYAFGELLVAIFEILSGVLFLIESDVLKEDNDSSVIAFGVIAVLINIIGWLSVYIVGGCCTIVLKKDYNPSLMQRVFHYCMIIMVWSLHEYSTLIASKGEDGIQQ